MSDVFKLPVFPAADVFPMMADDELSELAEDIAANGLHEPLVKAEIETPDEPKHPMTWMLIDGRNRRAACKLAGIEPRIRVLNGDDPTAYVLSANIHRRHLTKGQRAMAVAMIYPKPERGRGKKDPAKGTEQVSYSRVKVARTVLQYAPDLADNVLSGAESLDAAYKTAGDRKTAASSEETQLAKLRARYPELADKVVEEELTLPGARAEAAERDEREKTQRCNLFSHVGKIVYVADIIGSPENIENVVATLARHGGEFEKQEQCSVIQLIEACKLAQSHWGLLVKSLQKKAVR